MVEPVVFFKLQFHGDGVVMHGHSYGKLTTWDKHAAQQANMIGFPRGRLVLEAQAHLMGFLRSAVEPVLENLLVNEPESSAKWTQRTRSEMTSNGGLACFSTCMYQPYSAPPTFNIDSLVEQVKARVEATGDHFVAPTGRAFIHEASNKPPLTNEGL